MPRHDIYISLTVPNPCMRSCEAMQRARQSMCRMGSAPSPLMSTCGPFARHACSFIKDLLNPLHKSRLITHENYSTIVKVSAKRCASLDANTTATALRHRVDSRVQEVSSEVISKHQPAKLTSRTYIASFFAADSTPEPRRGSLRLQQPRGSPCTPHWVFCRRRP